MPTTTIAPQSAPGSYADWDDGTAGGVDATKLTAVQSSGGNYIAQIGDGAGHYCTFDFGAGAPGGMVAVTTHTITALLRHNQGAARNVDLVCIRSGTYQATSSVAAGGSFTSYNASDLGGASIPASEFSTIQYGVWHNLATAQVDCDQLSLSITYISAAGGFSLFVTGLAGAALGLAEMPRLAAEVFKRTRTRILPSEYLEAWRDIRDYRWPRTFEMRGALWI